ncbi:putative spermidine/putrescine transport system substrate-binding protein [Devosia subaequoris]|uniref:Putative spermidine/putrescine transport system substrate-binding protein n=1 Tax=Devosia subaequoris TaxID=395930 RepID=A0A7W6IL07_9HYPH|nr:extracellular solute-binding protein [Devosia subaequoris]MBB4051172.1 putative spermidine/putrescine transport system substrate-binding protein [Devosia subaequoris]MCP1208164.1 extracellular solute-binding protein [Devosia subaequoris]
MKRRDFMISAAGLVAGSALLPRMSFAAEGVIDWYTSSDSNILDFWTNTVKPAFEAANPGVSINLVDAGDGAGIISIAERAMAAKETGTDPQADFFESGDAELPAGAIEAGIYANIKEAGLSNYDKVNPLAIESDYSLPYRGSQVLLAYDSSKLSAADAPKNWDDLVAWIKANPGQFVYNRPDKGGSGGNFVRRAIHQANGLDPSKFTVDNYTEEFGNEALGKAWELLQDIAPSLYDNGAYSSGNTQSIQLLAQGVVTMTPVWSDQVLQAIDQGVLPADTGLVQLQDLALAGGFTRSIVIENGVNRDASLKLADFILSEEIQSAILTELGGFPGVSWDYVAPELRERFADIVPKTIPTFPGGDWSGPINDGWYRNVAPNVDRNS